MIETLIRSMTTRVAPRLKVLAHRDRVEADLPSTRQDGGNNSRGPNCSADALYPSLSSDDHLIGYVERTFS